MITIIHYMFFFTSSDLFPLFIIALKSTLVCKRANEAKFSVSRIINVKQSTFLFACINEKIMSS